MTNQTLRPLWEGQFARFNDWVTYATGSLGGRPNSICFDAKGRRCLIGKDFMRARDEEAFPVRFFWDMELDPVPAELDKWQDEADAMARGMQASTLLVGHLVARFRMIDEAFAALTDDAEPARFEPSFRPAVPSPSLASLTAVMAATREDIAALTETPVTG